MKSLYTRLVSGAVFPLHERLKGHDSVAALRDLEMTQWLDRGQLHELQTQRLRDLLIHAQQTTAYYRDLFASRSCNPCSDDPWSVLASIPALTKPLIRDNFENLKSTSGQPVKIFSTTGSSGDPLRFGLGTRRVSRDIAAKWRATRWWDVDIGDREIVAWSSPIELNKQDHVKKMRDLLLRTRLLPAIALEPEKLDYFIDEILSYQPRMLFGYPSSLTLVAQRALDRKIDLTNHGIKVVFTTAERLYPHQRHTLQTVFGAPVANGYGGRDAGFIAHECPSGNMHLTAEDIIVEILDSDGNPLPLGQPGQVAITHLHTHEFPFIRYLNGDVASLSDELCSCGRPLPLLKEIQGRTNDFLTAENGAQVHDVAFAMLLRDMPGMRQFKIVQETISEISLFLVITEQFDKSTNEPRIRQSFSHFLGKNVVPSIHYVSEIAPEPSGKYRYVVNRLAQQPSSRHAQHA